jgi:hypothetical protein
MVSCPEWKLHRYAIRDNELTTRSSECAQLRMSAFSIISTTTTSEQYVVTALYSVRVYPSMEPQECWTIGGHAMHAVRMRGRVIAVTLGHFCLSFRHVLSSCRSDQLHRLNHSPKIGLDGSITSGSKPSLWRDTVLQFPACIMVVNIGTAQHHAGEGTKCSEADITVSRWLAVDGMICADCRWSSCRICVCVCVCSRTCSHCSVCHGSDLEIVTKYHQQQCCITSQSGQRS